MISFFQVSIPKSCMHFSLPPQSVTLRFQYPNGFHNSNNIWRGVEVRNSSY